jgi:hypothetical protein
LDASLPDASIWHRKEQHDGKSHQSSLFNHEEHSTFAHFQPAPEVNLLPCSLFNCSADVPFRKCFEKYSLSFLFAFILSFAAFFACLLGQTYLDF